LSCASAGDIASEDEKKHVPASQQMGNTGDKQNLEKLNVSSSDGINVGIKVNYVNGKPEVTANATGMLNGTFPIEWIDEWNSELGESTLLDAAKAFWLGKYVIFTEVLGAYIKNPTPYGNFYLNDGNTFTMTAEAEVKSVNSVPTIIATSHFKNKSNVVATYSAKISHQVKSTMTSSWSKTTTNVAEGEVSVSAEVFGAGVDASLSYEHKTVDQEAHTETAASTLTSGDAVQVTLKPGEKVAVNLVCSTGTVVVKVTYTCTPQNNLVAVFPGEYDGFPNTGQGTMESALATINQSKAWYAEEDLLINCYSNATVTVTKLPESEILGILGAVRIFQADEKENFEDEVVSAT